MPQKPPAETVTMSKAALNRVIASRVEATRARLGPRAELADELQIALASSVARIVELEGQVGRLRDRLADARPSTPSAWAHASDPRRPHP
jgi:hypothetical protein